MEKILLTGGAGFIGSHIAEKMVEAGHQVVVLDDLTTGNIENLNALKDKENFFFYQGSILDEKLLDELFMKYQFTWVNNHAAQKSIPKSMDDPLLDNELNVVGLLKLIAMCKKYQVENFLQVSSGGALASNHVPSKEEEVPSFLSSYAISKYAGEQYLKNYSELDGFNYVVLRYANVYGPRQVPEGECGVVPIFVENIITKKESLLFTYDDMPRGCTRDYVYVEDIASLNVDILEKKIPSGVYNVGSEIEVSMMDIYEEVAEVFESTLPILRRGPRQGDLRRSVLDAEKIRSTIGWQAETTFKNGLLKLKKEIES